MNDNFFEKHKKYILISTIVFVALCVFMVIYNSPTQKVKRVSQSIDTMISSYTEENAKGNLRGDIRGYLKDNPLPIGPKQYEEYMCNTIQNLINNKEKIKLCELLIGLINRYENQNVYDYLFNSMGEVDLVDRIEWIKLYNDLSSQDTFGKSSVFYSIENITREEVIEYVEHNEEKISIKNTSGGYYSNKKATTEKENYGLSTSRKNYYGDFATTKSNGERLDHLYEIHEVDSFKVYFRDNLLDEDVVIENAKYASPLLISTTKENELLVFYISGNSTYESCLLMRFD